MSDTAKLNRTVTGLVVLKPFGPYQRGDQISDPALVEECLAMPDARALVCMSRVPALSDNDLIASIFAAPERVEIAVLQARVLALEGAIMDLVDHAIPMDWDDPDQGEEFCAAWRNAAALVNVEPETSAEYSARINRELAEERAAEREAAKRPPGAP